MKHRLLAAALFTGFAAGIILGLAGCAGKKSSIQGDTVQDQQGIANVATGSVTGLSYQSVLPMGMVILLTVIVLSQTASNSFEDWLLYRQQMAKLKNGNPKP
jgi:hypothetical protein